LGGNVTKNFEKAYSKLYNQTNVAVLVNSMNFYQDSIASRGELLKRVFKEDDESIFPPCSCGMSFPTNDKLYESFNRKIQQLHEAGIIKKIIDENNKFLDPKFYEKPLMTHKEYMETTWRKSFVDEPQILTWEDLEFGFVIWFGSLAFPLIIFIVEMVFDFVFKVVVNIFIQRFLSIYFKMKQAESKMKFREFFIRKVDSTDDKNLVKLSEITSKMKYETSIAMKEDDIDTIYLKD
jgi:hypothetical protein